LASTSDSAANLLAEVGAAADEAGLATALIGGAAVNAFEDPRFTKDLDLTVQADARAVSRFVASLERNGFEVLRRQDEGSSSGPDFVQLIRPGTPDMIDIITAKTEYQQLVIERAIRAPGQSLPIATPEDLIVLKLIANRPIDHTDTFLLARDNPIDWSYVEQWAKTWDVVPHLEALQAALGHPETGAR
jgi:hypothetical protein